MKHEDQIVNLDVASLEHAIVAAVAPPEVLQVDGWIVGIDNGTVSRARSAAPLAHDRADPGAIGPIRAAYAARGFSPMFRVPVSKMFAPVETQLERSGMRARQPTEVQVADTTRVARAAGASTTVRIDAQPDAAWAAVFLGEGFDPVDGACRVATLRRARGSLFASIREGDLVVAAGVLAIGHGWASIHGMRTALSHRGRGLASQVVSALAQHAAREGFARIMLQVEQENTAAQRLYARCGFQRAWTYQYWRER